MKDAPPAPQLVVTERAALEVKRHIADMESRGELPPGDKLYLRVRIQGGGCSGFQNKLDLDAKFDEKTDHKFEAHGVEVVVDKRSMLYLAGATVDFHDDLNKRGFTVSNPQAKGTCGCGSSYSM
ncbi:MAG: iron-sulfur cluster assembly accessory protein [Planctomycetes bacterium]|nr:iron-sulfur cluster assembly accessory protein [Planctomycetota bacterium]